MKGRFSPATWSKWAGRLLVATAAVGCLILLYSLVFREGTLPVAPEWWPWPTDGEIEEANADRYDPPNEDAVLALSVESIGLYGVPVVDSGSDEDLDQGVIHLPETPMPWEEREQKNVYLAGHRVGNRDTTGRMVFFNLDKLESGDEITLKDSSGESYEYEVSEIFVVKPSADWVIDPVRNRDMLTLQTCTYHTFFANRIVVRADRV
jgi:sortase A